MTSGADPILLPRRSLLAIAAVVDVALHARPAPVAAKALAERHGLPPRHLETLLQALVRAGILKGVRGPRGGYELARERRRVTAADIVRATLDMDEPTAPRPSRMIDAVVAPMVRDASAALMSGLASVSVEDLCRAEEAQGSVRRAEASDFTI